jgi:glycosyltransferase involved in cell wall biosynthesis
LLGDESLRQQMGSNAAKYAQNYDWEKIAKQIVDVYTDLIGIE